MSMITAGSLMVWAPINLVQGLFSFRLRLDSRQLHLSLFL